MRFQTIIIGVDFTPDSLAAARWVAECFPRARQVLVHACPPPTPARVIGWRFASGSDLAGVAAVGAQERLEEFARELPGDPKTLVVRTGDVRDVLPEVAADHEGDLIVIGPHAPRPGLRRLTGSTGEALMQASALPLLLVGAEMTCPVRRIIAPVDGSPVSAEVLRAASGVADAFDATLQALHVHDTATYAALSVLHANDRARVERAALRETSLWFAQYREAAGLEATDVDLVVTFGEARHEILAMAQQKHADLIVMASHGAGGAIFGRMVGSVAAWLLRYTRRSLLVLQGAATALEDHRQLERVAAR